MGGALSDRHRWHGLLQLRGRLLPGQPGRRRLGRRRRRPLRRQQLFVLLCQQPLLLLLPLPRRRRRLLRSSLAPCGSQLLLAGRSSRCRSLLSAFPQQGPQLELETVGPLALLRRDGQERAGAGQSAALHSDFRG
jgi:hypothetical protein